MALASSGVEFGQEIGIGAVISGVAMVRVWAKASVRVRVGRSYE